MNISLDDMKSCIQEWLLQALSFEELGEIYKTVSFETEKMFVYVAKEIAKATVESEESYE